MNVLSFMHAFNTSGYKYGPPFGKASSIEYVYSKYMSVTDKKLLINGQTIQLFKKTERKTRSYIFQLTLRKLV